MLWRIVKHVFSLIDNLKWTLIRLAVRVQLGSYMRSIFPFSEREKINILSSIKNKTNGPLVERSYT